MSIATIWLIGVAVLWLAWSVSLMVKSMDQSYRPMSVDDWCGQCVCVIAWPLFIVLIIGVLFSGPLIVLSECVSTDWARWRDRKTKEVAT